MALIEELLHHT